MALTIGGFGPLLLALGSASRSNVVRDYPGMVEEEPVEPVRRRWTPALSAGKPAAPRSARRRA